MINTTRPFMTGRSQAVRIPKEYRFSENEELIVNRIGDSIVITPKKALATSFFAGAAQLDDDFMENGRPPETFTLREALD